jgi:hypothetical protein
LECLAALRPRLVRGFGFAKPRSIGPFDVQVAFGNHVKVHAGLEVDAYDPFDINDDNVVFGAAIDYPAVKFQADVYPFRENGE